MTCILSLSFVLLFYSFSGGLFSNRFKLFQSTANLVTVPLRESSDFEFVVNLTLPSSGVCWKQEVR